MAGQPGVRLWEKKKKLHFEKLSLHRSGKEMKCVMEKDGEKCVVKKPDTSVQIGY